MSGFDELETAQRVRDLLSKQTSKVIQQQVPKSLVGRVIQMNPTRLKGMVWFPGDEQPIEVNFFPTTLPSSWSEKDRAIGAAEGSSTTGFGSMVRVERINGLLYVTDVLTGGSFGYNTQTMGQTIVKQQPNVGVDPAVFPAGAGITGTADEATVAVRVGFAANLSNHDGVFFGPFVRQDKTEAKPGTLEIIVRCGKDGINGVKLYEAPMVVANELKGMNGTKENIWFRILPKHSSTVTDQGTFDWDLDINVVDTGYSEVKGTFMPAFWLRITRARGGPDEIYDVTLRSTAFDQVGGYNLAESFLQQQHLDPPPPYGYLGFHNSNALYPAMSDYTYFETFNRVVMDTGDWGLTFTKPGSASGAVWQVVTGGGFGVDQAPAGSGHDPADAHYHAICEWSAAPINSTRRIRWGFASDVYTDMDVWSIHALQKMPAGAASSVGWDIRSKNSNADKINVRLDHYSSQEVYLKITKTISGTETTVGTDTLAITGWDQTKSVNLKFRVRGTLIQMKAWVVGTDEPATWGKTETIADAVLQTPGNIVWYATHFGGSTVTTPAQVYAEYVEINVTPTTPPAVTNKPWSTGPWRDSMLRLANDMQNTWYVNGDFRWNGTAISWTGNIWFQGVGPNRNGLIYGRAGLTMPDVGRQIPIVPYPTATYATVTSSGIPLAPFQSLWCAMEPGAVGGIYAMEGQLFIVDSSANAIGQDYYLPEWAVLLATASSLNGTTSPDLRLGNGQQLSGTRKMLAYSNEVVSSSGVTPATSPAVIDIPGLTMSVPVNARGARFVITTSLDVDAGATGGGAAVVIAELVIDGVVNPGQILSDYETVNKRSSVSKTWRGTLDPKASYANYAVKIQTRRTAATGVVTIGGQHCNLGVDIYE